MKKSAVLLSLWRYVFLFTHSIGSAVTPSEVLDIQLCAGWWMGKPMLAETQYQHMTKTDPILLTLTSVFDVRSPRRRGYVSRRSAHCPPPGSRSVFVSFENTWK